MMVSDEIGRWLEGLQLGRYAEAFKANDIDLRSLPYLSDEDLTELGVSLGHRRILLAAIASLERDETPRHDETVEAKQPPEDDA